MNNIEMLRWVLAGIGIFLVVLLYWFGRADKRNYRKRASHVRSSQPVEPYMSDEALSLDLDASQREEISREIQSSPATNGVFDKVDEFYEEVIESEESHDEVVSVPVTPSPDLPSFSATSEPQVNGDKGNVIQTAETGSGEDVDAITNVPAWLQQSIPDEPVSSKIVPENSARPSGTVGLFQSDIRDPKTAPSLPEKNSQPLINNAEKVKRRPEKSRPSSAIPENYSEKIKQAVAAVTNIERSLEESVPENRNLFDKLPRRSEVDSGIQKENVFNNDKEVESAKEIIVEAEQALEKELVASDTPSLESSESERNIKQTQDKQQENDSASISSAEAEQQSLEQANAVLQSVELAEKGKSTAVGGQTVFYPANDNEKEPAIISTSIESDSSDLKEASDTHSNDEKEIQTNDKDNTVVRIDPSRFRKSQAQKDKLATSSSDVSEKNQGSSEIQGDVDRPLDNDTAQANESVKVQKETPKPQTSSVLETAEVPPNTASIQVVETKETSNLVVDTQDKVVDVEIEDKPSVAEKEPDQASALASEISDSKTGKQKKKRVSGFDRNNPDADLISFYLINKDKPYRAKSLISIAAEHGLELDADGILYMAQDTGFAKDYVFSLQSIDDTSPLTHNDSSDGDISIICFKLLQGKEIVGRLNTLDSMLRLAKRIETDLGGKLYDVGYCPITDLMISHLRRQIQENDVKNCQ